MSIKTPQDRLIEQVSAIEVELKKLADGFAIPVVELKRVDEQIQWRTDNLEWNSLIEVKELLGRDGIDGKDGADGLDGEDGKDGRDGKDGKPIELRVTTTHIQWRVLNEGEWKNLIALKELKGPKGDKGEKGEKGNTGSKGANGASGSMGPMGIPGVGVPAGGTTGQVLAKNSNTNYDTEWVNQSGGGGGGDTEMRLQDEERTGVYAYVGYEHETNGSWYIYRRTRLTNLRLYAEGLSDYATNWTNRGSLSYA